MPATQKHTWRELVAVVALAVVIATYPRVTNGGIVQYNAAWVPELGLEFNLRMDGFAWLMATLITGIGLLVVLYARYYMSPADPVPRFFSFLLAFMGAMLGIVLSGNLIQLVFFWELTSLFSFLLIGYWHQTAQARDGARMALTITASGGLCLFAGVLILGHIVGSYDLDRVLASGTAIRSHSLYVPDACPHSSRCADEERPVSVSFLAATRHGSPHASFGLPALRDNGQSRRIPAGAPLAGAGRNQRVAVARRLGRSDYLHSRCVHRHFSAGPEGATCLFDH